MKAIVPETTILFVSKPPTLPLFITLASLLILFVGVYLVLWRSGLTSLLGRFGRDADHLVAAVAAGEDSLSALDCERYGVATLRDKRGYSALMWAAEAGDERLIERLLAGEADVSAVSDNGLTPLAFAAGAGRLGVMEQLVAAGADVDQEIYRGATALHFAASAGQFDAARYLIEQSAQVDARDDDGVTPLMRAIDWDGPSPELVEMLLEAGADLDARADDGRTPRTMILQTRRADLAAILASATPETLAPTQRNTLSRR